MGRKRDDIWKHVDILDDDEFKCKKFKCKFCGGEFAGGASRIKYHLSGIKRKGISICSEVTEDVERAASSAVHGPNKRVRSNNASSSNLEENRVNSSSPVGSSRGMPSYILVVQSYFKVSGALNRVSGKLVLAQIAITPSVPKR